MEDGRIGSGLRYSEDDENSTYNWRQESHVDQKESGRAQGLPSQATTDIDTGDRREVRRLTGMPDTWL